MMQTHVDELLTKLESNEPINRLNITATIDNTIHSMRCMDYPSLFINQLISTLTKWSIVENVHLNKLETTLVLFSLSPTTQKVLVFALQFLNVISDETKLMIISEAIRIKNKQIVELLGHDDQMEDFSDLNIDQQQQDQFLFVIPEKSDSNTQTSDNSEAKKESKSTSSQKRKRDEVALEEDKKKRKVDLAESEAIVTPAPVTTLSLDTIQKLMKLKSLLDSANPKPATITQELKHTIGQTTVTVEELDLMLSHLSLRSISDNSTQVLTKLFITSQIPHKQSCCFARAALGSKLVTLNAQNNKHKKASRQLVQSIEHIALIQPAALLESVFLPLVIEQQLSANQFEVINRVITTLPQPEVSRFIHELIINSSTDETSLLSTNWNDFVNMLLKNIFAAGKRKLLGEESQAMLFIPHLLLRLESVAPAFASADKSSKFAALCSTIISQFGELLIPHMAIMRGIVQSIDTFVKDKLVEAMDQLVSTHT